LFEFKYDRHIIRVRLRSRWSSIA